MKIYCHQVKIRNNRQGRTSSDEYMTVATNEEYICINDYRFTTLCRKGKDSLHSTLENVDIMDWGKTLKSMSGEFSITLYTAYNDSAKAEKAITKEFTKFLQKAVAGYLFDSTFKISLTISKGNER